MTKFSKSIYFYMLLLFGVVACDSSAVVDEDEDEITPEPIYSTYITDVFDYQYGPGQHARTSALGADGSNFIDNSNEYVLLGGWGGYIVAGFDHEIENQEGYDFGVFTQPGVGSEPGVVYVMSDTNEDGLPNDGEWIQLKGSEYENAETVQNYAVTYYKPNEGKNISWEDNLGNQGELVAEFGDGTHAWWWDETKEEVTFEGVKLPNSHYQVGQSWKNYEDRFFWGYAENYQGEDHDESLRANLFDISNAVDANGNKVELSSIKFIKVQTGVFQIAGHFNEISTEIRGAFDYRMLLDTEN
ncbi:hypothetical protein [Sediminitomix flava]|uniref:PKD domain-containing protein n=1 Tax=Sediminitomix flava TaxID=379075 RepID=A0A315ZY03_SEDFL|nr:hypothetical protein [Sediminitomix flava]PWJ42217.1 hypothetical protein BC781_103469 [Sediminitomix flava]